MRRSDKPCCENKILYKAIATKVLINTIVSTSNKLHTNVGTSDSLHTWSFL
jgi:hypothetical protein